MYYDIYPVLIVQYFTYIQWDKIHMYTHVLPQLSGAYQQKVPFIVYKTWFKQNTPFYKLEKQ